MTARKKIKGAWGPARPGVDPHPCSICADCKACQGRHATMGHDAGQCPACANERVQKEKKQAFERTLANHALLCTECGSTTDGADLDEVSCTGRQWQCLACGMWHAHDKEKR